MIRSGFSSAATAASAVATASGSRAPSVVSRDPRVAAIATPGRRLAHRQRLEVSIVGEQDRARGAHGQAGPRGVLRRAGADGDADDLARHALFLKTHGFFDGDFIEGVDRHLHVGEVDPRAIRLDPDLGVEVDHALHGDENFHVFGSLAIWIVLTQSSIVSMPRKPMIIFDETVVSGKVLLLTPRLKSATLSPPLKTIANQLERSG